MTRLSFLIRREWLSLIFAGVLVMLLLSALMGSSGPRDLIALQQHRTALEARRDLLAGENSSFRKDTQKFGSDDRYLQPLIRRVVGYSVSDDTGFKFRACSRHARGANAKTSPWTLRVECT